MASKSRRSSKSASQCTPTVELMDVDEGEVFSDNHQLMLQYLMRAKMAKEMDLLQVHKKLFNDSESLEETLRRIVSSLSQLKMDIKDVVCDVEGEKYYVFIQSTGEAFFQKSCPFNRAQLEFLKKVVITIASTKTGKISRIEALNICETLTKSNAQVAVNLFLKEKLLIEIERGVLCLSPLAVVEFEPFFQFVFEDNLKGCGLCKRLAFYCITCPECSSKFHRHCVTKWLNQVCKQDECPNCNCKWEQDVWSNIEL